MPNFRPLKCKPLPQPRAIRCSLQSAIDAVKQWRYKPTIVNDQSVEVETTVTVKYTLKTSESPQPPPEKEVPCTLGKVEFQDQGNMLVGSLPYTYAGAYELQTLAIRGVPLKADKQPVSGITLGQSTLKAASGTVSFSIESRPSLGRTAEEGAYVLVLVSVKNTGELMCSQLVPYHRNW